MLSTNRKSSPGLSKKIFYSYRICLQPFSKSRSLDRFNSLFMFLGLYIYNLKSGLQWLINTGIPRIIIVSLNLRLTEIVAQHNHHHLNFLFFSECTQNQFASIKKKFFFFYFNQFSVKHLVLVPISIPHFRD